MLPWRITVKILILFSLLVLTFFFSMLPLVVRAGANRALSSRRRRFFRSLISLLSCFAAGVFIGMCLLDLFPEVEESIDKALKAANVETNFPMPEFIVVIGFLLLLIVEQFVLTWKGDSESHSHGPVVFDYDSLQSSYNSAGPSGHPETSAAIDNSETAGILGSSNGLISTIDDGLEEENVLIENEAEANQAYTDPSSHSVIRSLILLIALSLHSLLEGIAVGLQETINGTVRLFCALLLHKCIVAFSIGLNMTQSKLSLRAIVMSNTLFSMASPIGIAIGIGVVNSWTSGMTEHAVIGSLNGLACGTFIYIVFFEILPHEFMQKGRRLRPDRMVKVFALIVGFTVVVGVIFLDPTV